MYSGLTQLVCAFVCGVTEPFEFAFMFLAPGLYVIYALLYGIFAFITTLVGFRAGFSFSAGATDLLFSASLRLEIKDYTQVDEKKIKSAGVAGVMRPSKTSVQVVVGTKVQFIADEMKKML